MTPPDSVSIEDCLAHDRWLRELARALARDAAEADELVQETWLASLRRPPNATGAGLRAWLARVLRNALSQRRRGDGRRVEHEGRAGETHLARELPGPERVQLDLERRRLVLEELEALDEDSRTLLAWRYLEGHSGSELARRLDRPLETVRSQLARARQRLRERLERRAGPGGDWLAALAPFLDGPLRDAATTLAAASAARETTLVSHGLPPWIAMKSSQIAAPLVALVFVVAGTGAWLGSRRASVGGSRSAVTPELDLPSTEPIEARGPSERARAAGTEASPSAAARVAANAAVATRYVEGRVFDLDGRALTGARIHARGASEPHVRSDEQGGFRWPLGASSEELVADLERHALVASAWTRAHSSPSASAEDATPTDARGPLPRATETIAETAAPAEDHPPLSIVLARAIRLTGTVVDRDGCPLADVQLDAHLPESWARAIPSLASGGTPRRWRTRSDAEGRFEFAALPAAPGALLWLRHADETVLYALPTRTREGLVLRFAPRTIDERWAGIPHVAGRVADEAGRPVAGVRIVHGEDWTDSDDQGHFRLARASLERCDGIVALATGFAPLRSPAPAGGWPDAIVLELVRDPGARILGRVVDENGRALEGASVWLLDPTPIGAHDAPDFVEETLGELRVQTAADGRFELAALGGREYRVAALNAATLARCERSGVRATGGELELVLPREVAALRLVGRCVGFDGRPLARVELEPQWLVGTGSVIGMIPRPTVTTDADGHFVFEALPGVPDRLEVSGPSLVPTEVALAAPGLSEWFAGSGALPGGALRAPRGAVGTPGEPARAGATIAGETGGNRIASTAPRVESHWVRPGEPLELVLPRRSRVHLSTSYENATHFQLLDPDGGARELYLFRWLANGTIEGFHSTRWGELEGGVSSTYGCAEGPARIVVHDGDVVLEAFDVVLVGGQLHQFTAGE